MGLADAGAAFASADAGSLINCCWTCCCCAVGFERRVSADSGARWLLPTGTSSLVWLTTVWPFRGTVPCRCVANAPSPMAHRAFHVSVGKPSEAVSPRLGRNSIVKSSEDCPSFMRRLPLLAPRANAPTTTNNYNAQKQTFSGSALRGAPPVACSAPRMSVENAACRVCKVICTTVVAPFSATPRSRTQRFAPSTRRRGCAVKALVNRGNWRVAAAH